MSKKAEENKNESAKILADHQKVKKKLVPPMIHKMPGAITSTYYGRDTLPELIWLALVEKFHGLQVAAHVAGEMGNFVKQSSIENKLITFSEMKYVSPEVWSDLKNFLRREGLYDYITSALHDFVVLFPECPLKILFEELPIKLQNESYLNELDSLVEKLSFKRGRQAVLMQANAVYMLGCEGRLFVGRDISIGSLESLKDYPDTDESKKVGASICAMSSMLISTLGDLDENKYWWPKYFWNRSLELMPLDFTHLMEKNGSAKNN